MVWPWLARAGVYLMARFSKKRLLVLAGSFGAWAIARPEGGYIPWAGEKKEDIANTYDDAKSAVAIAGAGIGIVLLLVIMSSYRRKGGD